MSTEKIEPHSESGQGAAAPRFRTRVEACDYVREKHGAPLSLSTADKLAALGAFARVAAYWGRRPLYADADLDAWVESRLRRRGKA
ncbi:hypothetical protein [Bradyrhizobium sp. Gha]|uniref:hypothetical protein n=1 Tax=Bradyrhizobium sp. Gha TaxID=1855318 RepID=UPI0008EA3B1C|nr:hypothetical protein [Bradyrhizobium sp. Gha]SFJ71886.1 hypothetical protein SAMN05216525_13319 [Bradyrhizobium sp. Gha]